MNDSHSGPLVVVRDLHKSYRTGEVETPVLRGVFLTVWPGTFTAIVGASGSGKTTLLGLIGGLDQADAGQIVIAGRDITRLGRKELTEYRGKWIGFIFQFFNLLPTLTALENVELGLEFTPLAHRQRRERARRYLERVGLGAMGHKLPEQLSGGEQQRVAIARALAREPELVLADEPTGNLDHSTGRQVFDLIRELQQSGGLTCLMVTHNRELAARTDQVVHLCDGKVTAAGGTGVSPV